MGNSNAAAASAAAANDAIQERIKKEKRKCKRLGCACCWINIGGIVLIVVGCVLLAYFGGSLTNENFDGPGDASVQTSKNVSYAGFVFLALGLLLIIIGIVIAIVVYALYRRFTGKGNKRSSFTPKTYAPGTAPYPQQDWGDVPNPHHSAGPVQPQPDMADYNPPEQPVITPEVKQPPAQTADPETIRPEVH